MPTSPSSLRDLFDAASELAAEQRAAFLDAHCNDAQVRERLERMLAAQPAARALPDTPADALADAIGDPESERAYFLGARIGPFEMLGILGEGGSATVFYAARDVAGVRQEVALKLLHRSLHSQDARRQFRRERLALTQLQHPGIARLIEGGVTETGLAYIALELVEGDPITVYASTQRLDLRARLKLFLQVCRAVDAAHRALIVHRDLKPSNVLVGDDGMVKVLDFGIAKLLDSEDDTTQTIAAFTPAYAAPEQRDGTLVTTATDVYALGVLLGELLTGQRLNESGARTPSGEIRATPDPGALPAAAHVVRRQLRGDIDNIVLKALDAAPERRYASAGAFAEDIERWLDGRTVAAHPPSQMYKLRKFVQRHRGAVAITCALLLAILGALGLALWQANVARSEAQRANAVKKFLIDIFDAAKANLPSNERPTPETLVREAGRRAREDAAIEPALRADLLRSLGTVSLTMGDYAQAETLLDETLQRLDEAGAARGSRERLDALVQKATLLQRTGRNDAADALLAQALPQLRRAETEVACSGLTLHAITRMYAGHADDARALARECAQLAIRNLPAESLERIKAESFPGQLDAGLRRWQDAAAQLEPIVTRWRKLGVPLDIDFAHALNNLATAKGRLGDRTTAEALYRENIALRRRIYGDRPNDGLAAALEPFALFLIRQDRYDEAQALLDEALAVNTQVFGSDHVVVAGTLDSLGTLEGTRRQFERAEKHLRSALAGFLAHVASAGEQDNDLAFTRMHLAQTLIGRHELDEAGTLAQQALEALRAKHGESSDLVASALALRGWVALERGELAAARTDADAAVAILAKLDPPSPLALITVGSVRARVLAAQQLHDAAIEQAERAIATLHAAAPDAHARLTALLALRAREEQALGHADAAQHARDEARALNVPAELLAPEDAATLGNR
jgi:tRNA A-37 threonylcarbamoyl transferase component Bud32